MFYLNTASFNSFFLCLSHELNDHSNVVFCVCVGEVVGEFSLIICFYIIILCMSSVCVAILSHGCFSD